MSLRLKDLIREFAPEHRPEEPLPTPQMEAAATPAFADGPSAVLMVEVMDAIAAICDLLDEETTAVTAGTLDDLEGYARRKQAMAERLERVMAQAEAESITLTDELRAMMLEKTERLERSIAGNTAGLVAVRKAVLAINRNLFTVLEQQASDGLYAPSGQAVRPVELSASGLNTEL
jgi:flagellar biosynthesis/type III secretory pathway chaperone